MPTSPSRLGGCVPVPCLDRESQISTSTRSPLEAPADGSFHAMSVWTSLAGVLVTTSTSLRVHSPVARFFQHCSGSSRRHTNVLNSVESASSLSPAQEGLPWH